MQDSGCRIPDAGYRIQDSGFKDKRSFSAGSTGKPRNAGLHIQLLTLGVPTANGRTGKPANGLTDKPANGLNPAMAGQAEPTGNPRKTGLHI